MADRIATASAFRACREKVTDQHVKMFADTFGTLKIWSLIDHGFFGVHKVRIEGSVFDLDDEGAPAFIFPINARYPDPSYQTVIDLWAVPVARPEMKARYRDNSDMLGEASLTSIIKRADDIGTIRVYRTVGGWVANGCDGVVPFDLEGRSIFKLMWFREIETDDAAFGRALSKAMKREALKNLPSVSSIAASPSLPAQAGAQ
jgi:hypothetical protein